TPHLNGEPAPLRCALDETMIDLPALRRTLVENNGSDLNLRVGVPPLVRVDGDLRRLQGDRLTPQDTLDTAWAILPPDRRSTLDQQKETDFAISMPGMGRFRVNVF